MAGLLLGVVALAVLLLAAKGASSADSQSLGRLMRYGAAAGLGLLAGVLALRGRLEIALPFFGGMLWVLGRDALFRKMRGGGGRHAPGGQGPRAGPDTEMKRSEALEVLGLSEGATEEEIREAHRNLILKVHPDKEGSSWLAVRINQARDVLLGS